MLRRQKSSVGMDVVRDYDTEEEEQFDPCTGRCV